MSGPTPGPWRACFPHARTGVRYFPHVHIGQPADGGYRGCGGPDLVVNVGDGLQGSDANAIAIAAVPDLIAALQPIAAAYDDDPGTSDLDNEQPVTITLGDVRRAWAALSKAGVR